MQPELLAASFRKLDTFVRKYFSARSKSGTLFRRMLPERVTRLNTETDDADCVGDSENERVVLRVCVDDSEGVGDCVIEDVRDGVKLPERVRVEEADGVCVSEDVGVGLGLGERVIVDDGDVVAESDCDGSSIVITPVDDVIGAL